MLYFQNQKRYGTGNFLKDLDLGHAQPYIDKNPKDLTVLILEYAKII